MVKRLRKWIFAFFIFNFILVIAVISVLPRELVKSLDGARGDLFLVHLSLMAAALILLSFWVWKDGEQIEYLREQVSRIMGEKETEALHRKGHVE